MATTMFALKVTVTLLFDFMLCKAIGVIYRT